MVLLRYLLGQTYIRYGLGSVIALAADFGLFLALLHNGAPPVAASALGYALGILVHWLISSRLVFPATTAAGGRARTRQKALFVASALVGLVITTAIVALGDQLGILPVVSKLAAIVVSFQATYLLRKTLVFAP